MSWLDLSFKLAPGVVTKMARDLSLETQIVEKVPAWGLTVMRISGGAASLTVFLEGHFEKRAFDMHMNAMKHTETPVLGKLKDRKLKENRA